MQGFFIQDFIQKRRAVILRITAIIALYKILYINYIKKEERTR